MKIPCPFCGFENIEGADHCDACGQSLSHLDLVPPATELESTLLKTRVSDLDPKPPIVVTPETTIAQVMQTFVKEKIGCVFVVENGQIIGVFTERDALMRIGADFPRVGDAPVSEYMTRNPQSLEPDTKVAFGICMMDLGGYRHIPIINPNGEPIGVISVRDILRFFGDMPSVAGASS